jgi:hypothetical protein
VLAANVALASLDDTFVIAESGCGSTFWEFCVDDAIYSILVLCCYYYDAIINAMIVQRFKYNLYISITLVQ